MPTWPALNSHAVGDTLPIGDYNNLAYAVNLLTNSNGGFPPSIVQMANTPIAGSNPGVTGQILLAAGRNTYTINANHEIIQPLAFPNGLMCAFYTLEGTASYDSTSYLDNANTSKSQLTIYTGGTAGNTMTVGWFAIGF